MPASWALTPPYFLVFALLCGIAGFRVGWRTGNRVALPLVQGALGWVAFVLAWTILDVTWAAACVGAWAVGTTIASVGQFVSRPVEVDQRVIRAAPYRASMLEWLETGRGPEQRPWATAARHLREAIWYTAAAVTTANFASIAMGAVLLNEMNAYVATLLRAAKRTGRVLLLAWNVWSVVRVAAYVLIGAAAATPLLRLWGLRAEASAVRTLVIWGGIGIVVDLLLKLVLSRFLGRLLSPAVDVEAAKANRSPESPLALHLD